jgi:hypothetical protein
MRELEIVALRAKLRAACVGKREQHVRCVMQRSGCEWCWIHLKHTASEIDACARAQCMRSTHGDSKRKVVLREHVLSKVGAAAKLRIGQALCARCCCGVRLAAEKRAARSECHDLWRGFIWEPLGEVHSAVLNSQSRHQTNRALQGRRGKTRESTGENACAHLPHTMDTPDPAFALLAHTATISS